MQVMVVIEDLTEQIIHGDVADHEAGLSSSTSLSEGVTLRSSTKYFVKWRFVSNSRAFMPYPIEPHLPGANIYRATVWLDE